MFGLPQQPHDVQWFKTAVEHALDAIFIANTEARILYINPEFEKMTGYTAAEIVGEFAKVLRSGEHSEHFYDNSLAQVNAGNIWSGELSIRRKDGILVQVERRIAPIVNEAGVISHSVVIQRNITQRMNNRKLLRRLAYHDALTNLPNRRLFTEYLEKTLRLAQRRQANIGVIFIDLDEFKEVNDIHGHGVGDQLLIEVSDRLLYCVRKSDVLARLGGDEFAMIIDTANPVDDFSIVANKILSALNSPMLIDEHHCLISASIGISIYPQDGDTAMALLKNADTAMYQAKSLGKRNYQFYSRAMSTALMRRVLLNKKLRHALERKEFSLNYQPIIDIKSGVVSGVEALLRWNNDKVGIIGPDEFIPLLEDSGDILAVGAWVIEQSLATMATLQGFGVAAGFFMSINLSPKQLAEKGLVAHCTQSLHSSGVDASNIRFEVTEGLLLQENSMASNNLQQLNALGIALSIDDFGTGYASINYLRKFPFKCLKIDQSYVQKITHEPLEEKTLQAILDIAKNFEQCVIAEGVETIEQYAMLKKKGCDYIQGNFFSKPLPYEELLSFLERGNDCIC